MNKRLLLVIVLLLGIGGYWLRSTKPTTNILENNSISFSGSATSGSIATGVNADSGKWITILTGREASPEGAETKLYRDAQAELKDGSVISGTFSFVPEDSSSLITYIPTGKYPGGMDEETKKLSPQITYYKAYMHGNLLYDKVLLDCYGTCGARVNYDSASKIFSFGQGTADAGYHGERATYIDTTNGKLIYTISSSNGAASIEKEGISLRIEAAFTPENLYRGLSYTIKTPQNDRNGTRKSIPIYTLPIDLLQIDHTGAGRFDFTTKIDTKRKIITIEDEFYKASFSLEDFSLIEKEEKSYDPTTLNYGLDNLPLNDPNICHEVDNIFLPTPLPSTYYFGGLSFHVSSATVKFDNDPKEYPIKNFYRGYYHFTMSEKLGNLHTGENNLEIIGYDDKGKKVCSFKDKATPRQNR